MFQRAYPILSVLAVALLFSSCAERGRQSTQYMGGFRPQQGERANYDNVSYWDGDGAHGSPSIRISIGEQRAYFYKGGELVGVSVLSTGREGHDTPVGTFRIQQKDISHKSSLYGDYVTPGGQVVRSNIDRNKDPQPPGTVF